MDTLQQTSEDSRTSTGERQITITERERQFLLELLQGEVPALRSEVYRAESHEVKELLKEREACAKRLLEQLQ
jgi:hypothetical protein